jgi:HK97 family phage prohead protease
MKTLTAPITEKEITKREIGEKIRLTLSFDSASTKDLGDGTLEAVITTNSTDRYNEQIDTSGVDTSSYMSNPVVLYGHDYEGLPIGKTLKLTEMKNKIKARFQLAVEEYPFAATVYAMVKGGYINAVSIGGLVREWSDDYRTILKMDMVEFSLCAVPANPEALITGRSLEAMTGKSIDTIREEFQNFSKNVLLDKMANMPEDEVNDAITVLKNLVARLEEAVEIPPIQDEKQITRVRRFALQDAKAVAAQSHKVIKTLKLSIKE